MIKVINICSDTNIGGAGRCILTFLRYYDRSKFDVSVLLPPGSKLSGPVEELGTEVLVADSFADKSLSLGGIRSLYGVLGKNPPHVVHTHGAMSGRIAAKLRGCGIVYTRHSVFPVSGRLSKNPGKWINGRINECFSDAIIAVAEAAKENVVMSGVSTERVEVILNGVEAQPRVAENRAAELRRKYGISENDFVVGILARLEDVKGHGYLLEAAKQLKNEGRSIKVIIAGAGGIEERLKKEADHMGLGDTVIFAGFVTDVPEILGIMDVQINASYGTEATSLSLLEGMSIGLPAIVSDYGGNPGVISDGVNGLIFRQRDSAALTECIRKVMEDRELLDSLRIGSLKIFQSKFTAERYTRDIEKIYERIYTNLRSKRR